MSRPENSRCENCCYWERRYQTRTPTEDQENGRWYVRDIGYHHEAPSVPTECTLDPQVDGRCRRGHESLTKRDADYCGEFRAAWPEE